VIFRFSTMMAAAVSAVMVAGCAAKYDAITPEVQAGMMSDLRAGKMNLDCGEKCMLTWMAQAPSIHALDLSERWNDLAVRVMQIGFGNDLAYYYLGQSAQGLGYHPAAITYYSQSLALATGMNPLTKCTAAQGAGNDPCQGVDIVSSIPVLIKASQDAMNEQQQASAPVHHHHKKPVTAPPADAAWVAPPPPPTGSDWVPPPQAAK
jgi:hypothetical protein